MEVLNSSKLLRLRKKMQHKSSIWNQLPELFSATFGPHRNGYLEVSNIILVGSFKCLIGATNLTNQV